MVWPANDHIVAGIERSLAEARAALPVEEPAPILLEFAGGYRVAQTFNYGSWLYVFEDCSGDTENTQLLAQRARTEGNPYKLPKLNAASPILYVGSSSGGRINSRIQQHLRLLPNSTYALSLGLWFRKPVRLHLRRYEVGKEALQILEDGLAGDLAPALGKRGGNGR